MSCARSGLELASAQVSRATTGARTCERSENQERCISSLGGQGPQCPTSVDRFASPRLAGRPSLAHDAPVKYGELPNYVGGAYVPPMTGRRDVDVNDPRTGDVIARVPLSQRA